MMPLTETGVLSAAGALVAAPLIGFAFGWFLERGGLGSARKLSGQFYLADLTVYKVMFSALVTAMLGAFWLDRAGLLALDLVYLPETFVVPQAIGGVLFGAGFLVGGLCPGTSCVAAVSGKLDGFAVAGGMLGGVVLFNAAFDLIGPVYESGALGSITLADLAGVPFGAAVAVVTAIAVAGFLVAPRLEHPESAGTARRSPHGRRLLLAMAATLAIAAAVVDDTASATGSPSLAHATDVDAIEAPALADRIIRGDETLLVLDVRSRADFDRFHIPGATHALIADLAAMPLDPEAHVVVYADDPADAAQAWMMVRLRGHRSVQYLRDGVYEWIARVHEPRLATDATPAEREAFERAAAQSRFFGGMALADVPRSDVPTGYWGVSADTASHQPRNRAERAIAAVRRRGC